MKKSEYITISQLAEILGISRIAVYKKVKAGKIEAIRIGKNYAIPAKYINYILGKELRQKTKKEIENAVKKIVEEYGEVLEKLGQE